MAIDNRYICYTSNGDSDTNISIGKHTDSLMQIEPKLARKKQALCKDAAVSHLVLMGSTPFFLLSVIVLGWIVPPNVSPIVCDA